MRVGGGGFCEEEGWATVVEGEVENAIGKAVRLLAHFISLISNIYSHFYDLDANRTKGGLITQLVLCTY